MPAKIKKEPLKVRVISVAEGTTNRAQRRQEKRVRTSATICTKKWTRGRLKPRLEILKLRMSMTPKKEHGPFNRLLNTINKKLGIRK